VTGGWWPFGAGILGALYAASLPYVGWLVLEAHRIRRDARDEPASRTAAS